MADSASSALADLPLLRFVPPPARALIERSFVPVGYDFGATVVREGDEADAFYVLVSGRVRVVRSGPDGDEIPLAVLRPGASFGESALLGKSRRTATVRASSAVELLRLDRSVFAALVELHPEIRTYLEIQINHRALQDFLRLHTPFASLPAAALETLLRSLRPVTVARGQAVVTQGQPAGPMYVVEEGRLRVFEEKEGQRRPIRYLRRGDFFGERSLFLREPRSATVEAVSDCRLLSLTPEVFERLVADHPEFRARVAEQVAMYSYKAVARVPLDFNEENLPADVGAPPPQAAVAAAPEPEPPAERERRRRRRIRRFPLVRQIDEMDCGAACVAMICRHFGRDVSLSRIRRGVATSFDGTSLKGICRGAEEVGLAARATKASKSNLDQLPLPAVVHWEGNHWVVLFDVGKRTVRIADPVGHIRRVERAVFLAKWSGYAALFDYTTALEQAPTERAGVSWIAPFFRPYAGLLARAVGLATVVSALGLVLPIFTQVVVDRVVVERDLGLLHAMVGAMLGVALFMTAALFVQRYLLAFIAVRIDSATLDFLTRKLLSLPMSYFTTCRTGDIQRRLEGIRQVRQFLVESGVAALSAGTQLVLVLVLMLLYNPWLTLVFLATTPLYAALMRFSSTRLRPLFSEVEHELAKYYSHQIDAIKGIETVKALAAESAFREVMLRRFHGLSRRLFGANFIGLAYDGATQTVSFLTLVLFLWAGATQVMQGGLTVGGLIAFNTLVAMGQWPIRVLLSMWDGLQWASVLLERLNDIFDQEPEQGHDRSKLLPVRTLEGRVRLSGVGFRYGGPDQPPILDNITFDVRPGERIAIVGRSGSGKTTLIKCLAGLLEPGEGTIRFDNVDLRSLSWRDLRRQIGFVLQENFLFSDTVARNIALGDEPDMDRVLWAARVASAHEFIERLPLGYDSPVGESGIALSGGQRQRVAIARAVYHQPPILIFDEATSALDTESERAVKENLDQLLRGRTSFVIAHRLSTVRDADRILVLEKGRLVEQGSHDELMKRQGLYFYLCSQQLGVS